MNIESRQLIEALQADGDNRREAEDWGAAKAAYAKAIEEFERIGGDDTEMPLTADDLALRKEIEAHLGAVDARLARSHFEWGKTAYERRDWERALEELEMATELAGDDDVAFLEQIKPMLDKARVKTRDRHIHDEITPLVERGDNFRRAENFGEAILEYQEAIKALAGLPAEHRYVVYVREVLRECRRHLVKPYLARIHRASQAGRDRQAFALLKRAQLLIDENDLIYRAFIDQIGQEIAAKLTKKDLKEIEESDEGESADVWSKAVAEYEEALDLYSSFTQTDPLSPAYAGANIYEDKFVQSRRKLATLYRQRGDRFRDKAVFDKAIRQYREALKLFPRSDKAFYDTFREMKKLRAQIAPASA
ncbi:MAG TPA: hypothetical protein PLP29_06615 [Candidatus Ozemobacteraceae bacterium]|nr:hypothetical protein [Candidatus Ozemobacteraceae bacterium]